VKEHRDHEEKSILRIAHNCGATSNLSVRLSEVCRFRGEAGRWPDGVSSSGDFNKYRSHESEDVSRLVLGDTVPYSGPLVEFHHTDQYTRYGSDLDLPALHQLARHYCWPSARVIDVGETLARRFSGRVGVLYRGLGKEWEIARTPYGRMFDMAEETGQRSFFLQTDEDDFYQAFRARFPDTLAWNALPRKPASVKNYVMPPEAERPAFLLNFLAVLYGLGRMNTIISNTGNTALWMMIWRGTASGVWQYHPHDKDYGKYE
jgi:hypothetical protein